MKSLHAVLIAFLYSHSFFLQSYAEISTTYENAPSNCGSNNFLLEIKTSVSTRHIDTNKYAILIDGSPVTKFFSDNRDNYQLIANSLLALGYKTFEIRYPEYLPDSFPPPGVEGFYAACNRQGMDNVAQHAADLYELAKEFLGYDSTNASHQIVGFGFSIGAILLQAMAFTHGKDFDRIGLTGVLLGDAVKGCTEGLKVMNYFEDFDFNLDSNDFCSETSLFNGMSWISFMGYVQQITTSGEGCCYENSDISGACSDGISNEYTSKLNFDNQPYYKNSKLAMFEGLKTCVPLSVFDDFASANPAQVQYIAQKRIEAGAPTEVFFYEDCDHSIINCSGTKGLSDIVTFLTKE